MFSWKPHNATSKLRSPHHPRQLFGSCQELWLPHIFVRRFAAAVCLLAHGDCGRSMASVAGFSIDRSFSTPQCGAANGGLKPRMPLVSVGATM